MIVRRERPHPGAQLSFTDVDGHRFQATLDRPRRLQRSNSSACTEAARNAEDRVRAAKQTGLDNLPFREFALNAVWLELSLIAQDLSVWTQIARAWTASWPAANPRRCATGCCTPPAGWPSTPAAPRCACKPAGPGPVSSPPPSRACTRSRHPPPDPSRHRRRPPPRRRAAPHRVPSRKPTGATTASRPRPAAADSSSQRPGSQPQRASPLDQPRHQVPTARSRFLQVLTRR